MKFETLPLVALLCLAPLAANAQEQVEADPVQEWFAFLDSIEWVTSGGLGSMGGQGEITVPDGYVFTGTEGTQRLMEAFGNLLSDQEVGFVAPDLSQDNPDFNWFAVFEFDPTGYVKDDEKADLDADAMMESMIENEELANRQRQEMGYDTLSVTGWAMPPQYNERTHNLEWATILLAGSGTQVVNLNTRLLGREGVMKVTLVCDPQQLESTIPAYQRMLESYRFQEGRRYAEYRQGDKIAKYGLTGLVVGGGAAVLAKTGLLKRIFKPLLVGLLALGAFIKKFFTGRSRSQ